MAFALGCSSKAFGRQVLPVRARSDVIQTSLSDLTSAFSQIDLYTNIPGGVVSTVLAIEDSSTELPLLPFVAEDLVDSIDLVRKQYC